MAPTSKRKYEEKVTRLTNIEWEVGRLGILTPIAVCKPVKFDKSVVQRFLVYNYLKIIRMGLEINDWVDVVQFSRNTYAISAKAERLPNDNPIKISLPTSCPSCNQPIKKVGAVIKCVNHNGCRSQIIHRIAHYGGSSGLNIRGLNVKVVSCLHDAGFLDDASDIYRLKYHRQDIVSTKELSPVKANTLIEQIDGSLRIPLDQFICALGIPEVGRSSIDKLTRHYQVLSNIQSATLDELMTIKGIGKKASASIISWFADPINQNLIDEIKHAGAVITTVR